MNNQGSDVLADCSDEEEYSKVGLTEDDNSWSPFPADVIALYEKIAQHTILEFNWKCIHGRRHPDDEIEVVPSSVENANVSNEIGPEATRFDFEEESTPRFSRFGKSTPLRGGGKKKTTSLAGILSNMERHRIIDQNVTRLLDTKAAVGASSGLQFQSIIPNIASNTTTAHHMGNVTSIQSSQLCMDGF